MRHVMRQNRDGEIDVIDLKPGEALDAASILRAWRWTTLLLWFMRTMAVVWLAKGLLHWAVLLGASPRLGEFAGMPRPVQATTIFLAVAQVIAAIGLWLASPWGGVIWLATVMVELSALILGFALAANRMPVAALDGVLAAGYFFLVWRASRERS